MFDYYPSVGKIRTFFIPILLARVTETALDRNMKCIAHERLNIFRHTCAQSLLSLEIFISSLDLKL